MTFYLFEAGPVFINDGVIVRVVIRCVEKYDPVKITNENQTDGAGDRTLHPLMLRRL